MKNFNKTLCAIFTLMVLWNTGKAQTELIKFFFNDGTQQEFVLSEVRKMDFNATQMRLHQTDETIIAWNFDLIDYYSYAGTETNLDKLTSKQRNVKLEVFPNPALNVLNVSYKLPKQETMNVSIYSLTGERFAEQKINGAYEGTWQYDISQLPAGSYLIVMQGTNYSISKTIVKL